ncbi:MAG: AAA family ATPase [Pelagibacterales bacterium]|nr:AAA family ATPase [Pelagibacterales bacterium]
MKAAAQEYINQNIVVIPLSKEGDGKGTNIKKWDEKEFKAERFSDNNNIGINLKLSKKGDADWDSKEAVYFAPKFMSPTQTLGIKSPTGSMTVNTHYIYDEELKFKNISRTFPNKTTIAELRGNGNTVVAPSKAKSKLFSNQWCERVWTNERGFKKNPELLNQFNKVCVASVLKTVIESDNMPFVKLTACLKRYCTDWSEDELYEFIEIVCNSIKHKDGGNLFKWNDVKAKVKTVLNNWDDPKTHQSGYESFATEVGLELDYARDMFTWIGIVPKQGSKCDRKTIISFKASAMTEADFHKKVERSYLVSPLICDVGLYVLAGKPKGGKSRILKDLAYKVQNKTDDKWIGHAVEKGDVLLLALEDNADSMNIDIKEMGYQHKIKPTTFVEIAPTLDRGLEESIKLWTEEVTNPKLVILDTFQKIKPLGEQKTRNANAYEVDYHYLSKLHTLARELNICIIYVHHLSQADKTHSWDKIMGSTGHQGVTDAMYMLEREEGTNQATFKGIGRNIAEFKMDIEWNNLTYKFDYVGDSYLRKTAKHKKDIFKAMVALAKQGSGSVKPADVYKVLNLVTNKEKNTCNKNMQRMRKNHELREGEAFGEYKLPYPLESYGDDGEVLSGNEPWCKFNINELNNAKNAEQFELQQFGHLI